LHSVRVSRVLPYAPRELFVLVGGVEAYPEFVPWVTGLRVWNRQPAKDGVSTLDAEAEVGFAFVKEKFATRVRLDEPDLTITVGLLYGPFRTLRNRWRFLPEAEGTKVEFEIDFAFKSRILDALLAANMRAAAEKLIACFETRAKALHGGPDASGS
jgi:coenzyme Q-binding protein COQ10